MASDSSENQLHVFSANFFANHNAAYLFDNNNQTYWASDTFMGDNEVLEIKMQQPEFIANLKIVPCVGKGFIPFSKVILLVNDSILTFEPVNRKIVINKEVTSLKIIPAESGFSEYYNGITDSSQLMIGFYKQHQLLGIREILLYDSTNVLHLFSKIEIASHASANAKLPNDTSYLNNRIFGSVVNKVFISKIIDSSGVTKHVFIIKSNGNLYYYLTRTTNGNTEIVRIAGKYVVLSHHKTEIKIRLTGEKYLISNAKSSIKPFTDNILISRGFIRFVEGGHLINFDFSDDVFFDLTKISDGFAFDIRYATTNNFTKKQMYRCNFCYLRYRVALDLIKANNEFKAQGYRIKIFDAYRPLSVQYKLWEACPNPNFVANPVTGSIHNRGGAIDVTLETINGQYVDMGTDYDYFGVAAFHDNITVNEIVKSNRDFLRMILANHHFNSIKTEWWHYSHRVATMYPISDVQIPCN